MRPRPLVLAIAAILLPATLAAQGEIVPRRCPTPRCPPAAPFGVVRAGSEVRITLGGRGERGASASAPRVLSYEIEETFVNRGGALGEADYLFPLPSGAAFQDLRLEIDGELVAGETLDAREARAIYEEIVRRRRDPALVEWMGRGLLRARIFPIAPGERKRVVVRYQMVAPREGDALRVDYFKGSGVGGRGSEVPIARLEPAVPRSRIPDPSDDQSPDERGEATDRVRLTLEYPDVPTLGRAYSPTHALRARQRDGRWTVEVRGDAREATILIPLRGRDHAAIALLAHAVPGEDGFALVTITPPAAPPRVVPRDVTFVLDVSGSMRGRKLEQARDAGKALLATLAPRDRFRLVRFSTEAEPFREEWLPATRANLAAAERWLDRLAAEGSTNIEGALDEALAAEPGDDRLGLVLFLTDGEPTVGERDAEALARLAARRRGDARVFTFGLGADVNVALVERLAVEGRGTAHFVRPEESTERAVQLVASRLTSPVATGLRLRADGDVRLVKMHPSSGTDLFAGQELVVLARYEGSGRARLRVEGASAAGPVRWSADVRFPERERGNAFVPRLWATQRIGWLSAARRAGDRGDETAREIRELGERYGIPTEFTSYFVKEPGMQLDQIVTTGAATGVASGLAGGVARRERRADAAASAPAAPAPAREAAKAQAFEAARGAAAQRAATSLAAADSAAIIDADGRDVRRAAGRLFRLESGVLTDGGWRAGMETIRIQAYSEAWFALAERIPALREAFALGDRVIVAGRAVAVETGAAGASRLDARELARIEERW